MLTIRKNHCHNLVLFTIVLINNCSISIIMAGSIDNERQTSNMDEKQEIVYFVPNLAQTEDFKCIHCASPRYVLKKNSMQAAMDQLFELRGSSFPYSVIHPNCSNPINIDANIMYRETCKYPYCYAITFNDKEGKLLVIRGCAESFLATSYFKTSTKSVHCRRVHETLDIRECFCKNAQTCSSASLLSTVNCQWSLITTLLIALLAYCY